MEDGGSNQTSGDTGDTDDTGGDQIGGNPICICSDIKCTAANSECPVCKDYPENCTVQPEPFCSCNCSTKCTDTDINTACPVCKYIGSIGDGFDATLEDCTGNETGDTGNTEVTVDSSAATGNTGNADGSPSAPIGEGEEGNLWLPTGMGSDGQTVPPFLSDASASDGTIFPVGNLAVTPVSKAGTLIPSKSTELREVLEQINLAGSMTSLLSSLGVSAAVNRAISGTSNVEDLKVHSLFDVSVSGAAKRVIDSGGTVTLTFNVPGLNANNKAVVLHKASSGW